MTTETIKIYETGNLDMPYIVRWTFANGWSDAQPCLDLVEARAFALGLAKGITAVKNMIATGPRYDLSRVEKPE